MILCRDQPFPEYSISWNHYFIFLICIGPNHMILFLVYYIKIASQQ